MMEFLYFVDSLLTKEVCILMIGTVLGFMVGFIRGQNLAWDDAHKAYEDILKIGR